MNILEIIAKKRDRQELNKEEIDEKLYASSVVKLFIADFYDLSIVFLNVKITADAVSGIKRDAPDLF